MQLANQEAQRFNHDYVGTEHILLGLIKEGGGVGAYLLKEFDLDLQQIQLDIGKLIQAGRNKVTKHRLPQTPQSKKVIEYSMEESRALGHTYIGTEHILLGLLREKNGIAFQVLRNLGFEISATRIKMLDVLGTGVEEQQTLSPAETSSLRPNISLPAFVLAPKLLCPDSASPNLIAVDIGNSAVKFGHFLLSDSLDQNGAKLPDPITTLEIPIASDDGQFDAQLLVPWCEQFVTPTTRWAIASVNRATADYFGAIIAGWCKQLELDQQWQARGLTFKDVPMPIRVDEPERVGVDRLLAAFAANRLRSSKVCDRDRSGNRNHCRFGRG